MMDQNNSAQHNRKKLVQHFKVIYGEDQVDDCLEQLDKLIKKYRLKPKKPISLQEIWSHQDHVLITYGDMVQPKEGEPVSMLYKLHEFLKQTVKDAITTVHILPFFPSSSDDGFSVVDYKSVDTTLGGWDDIEAMSKDFYLMGDLVMNHVSRYSEWFKNYLEKKEPYKNYFIEVDPDEDMSMITRPRSSSILTHVHTKNGEKFVWSTFSDDQMDVDFGNPDVLFEYIDIFFFYLSKGLPIIRLDAVAFIGKKLGTSSIHLEQTHEIVKLIRSLIDIYAPEATIITETNVPHRENISYFGDGDEAHMVYQFSLPPLLLHAILTENASYLRDWSASLKKLPENCTFFNFTASHDGIGVRPIEGLVPHDEFDQLVEEIREKGGLISEKINRDGSHSPYEMNITYFDAFGGKNISTSIQENRFICSQMIAMSLVGVPGIYFHNLTASTNNVDGVAETGRYRTINRKKWDYEELMEEIKNTDTTTSRIFNRMKAIISQRKQQPAFHPFGGQKTYDLGRELFCIERWNLDDTERILVIANVTSQTVEQPISSPKIPLSEDTEYFDILIGGKCVIDGEITLKPYCVVWIKV
ncbi:MAG: sugar phosphorylase [Balneolaceae bacterium]